MDKDDLLAAMYMDSDEPAKVVQAGGTSNRTRKIRVGIIEYEVPSAEYVEYLEQAITTQQRAINRLQQDVDRMSAAMLSTRRFLRRQSGTIRELHAELDTKIGIVE